MSMMPKRTRRPVDEAEYSDPLKRYEAGPPGDEMERRLAEGTVAEMPITPISTISPISTVEQAVRQMAEANVGCLLVVEHDRLVGIFTQSDIVNRVVDRFEQIKGLLLREVMTADPVVVRDTDSPAKAINIMSTGGFRHVPVLDVDDHIVGLIGPRRTTEYLRQHFA